MIQPNVWKKGSRSNGTGGNNCVEVAVIHGDDVPISYWVRDSKDLNGPQLKFTPAEWAAFIESVKNGEFDLPG